MSEAVEYIVTGLDGTDEGAPGRRLAVRAEHLAGAQRLADAGVLRSAAALVDDGGAMIGSSLHVEFPDEDAFRAWYDAEPYITGGVWKDITIQPVKFFRPAA
ncbi:YciI family protein [Microbacterium sp.]|uniref:YciI family protein n=1 Tax=Microbacterium sp. TaxID=51671 RepID=UPI003C73CD31